MLSFDRSPREQVLLIFLINTGISIFLSLVLFLMSPKISLHAFGLVFAVTAIYSYSIGSLVGHVGAHFYPRLVRMPIARRILALNSLLILCGIAGTYIGHLLVQILIPKGSVPESFTGPLRGIDLLVCAAISVFFGNIVLAIRTLRDRWQQSNERLREQVLLQERLRKLKAEAELSALQARIQPHFLFNTLNSIASLVRDNPERAETVIEKLAGLFRYALASARGGFVTLGEELTFVSDYLEIEKVRLGRRLSFEILADEAARTTRLPGLLVQPLVENSVQHGIGPKEEGGRITVRAWVREARCCIEVCDDGAGFEGSVAGNGYALDNIRGRLEALYPSDHKLELERTADGRTRVYLEIPAGGVAAT